MDLTATGGREIEVVTTVADFRAILREIVDSGVNDQEFRQRLAAVVLRTPEVDEFLALDPFSEEYRTRTMQYYVELFEHQYGSEDEGLDLDIEYELGAGFPYGTKNAYVIGSFLEAYGTLIKAMDLPAGASILEMGCGTGSLTVHLARAGYDVTAIDINTSHVQLVTQLCPPPFKVEVRQCDMSTFDTEARYDAVVFFESLHHLPNHAEVVRRSRRWLSDQGRLYLMAEPVTLGSSAYVPYPWGLRMDGEALRAMAELGWFELGFQQDYLLEMVRRSGYEVAHTSREGNSWTSLYTCTPV